MADRGDADRTKGEGARETALLEDSKATRK
jgi:hypothetical protein